MISALLLTMAAATSAAPTTLTLEEALKQARANNLDIKVAQARLKQAREVSWQAWSGYLPHLSAGGAWTRNSVDAKLQFPAIYGVRDMSRYITGNETDPHPEYPGDPTAYIALPLTFTDPIVIQPLFQLAGQIELNQAILAPALWPAIQAGGLAGEIAELSVDAARREILFAVTQVYYGAVGAGQATAVQKAVLDNNIEHEKDAKVRVDSGVYPKLFLVRAQIDRTKAEQDYRSALNAHDSLISTLATLLNRSPDFDVTEPPEPPLPPDMEQSEAATLDARPDVKAARKVVEANKAGALSNILMYAPNIGLVAKGTATNMKGFTGQSETWSVALGLNWNLFDGGLRESNLRTSQAKVAESEIQRESAEAKARDEVRRARLQLETSRSNRAKAEDQARLARENATLVQVNFKNGVATYLEVADANLALNGAELNVVAQKLQSHLAVLQLAKAQGAFNPE